MNGKRWLAALLSLAMLLCTGVDARGAEGETCTPNGGVQLDPCWLEPDFAEGDYSMVVLPDTQFTVNYWPDIYYSQMQWIADNKETLNIQAVMHMGDMVNNNNDTEWSIFKKGTDIIDAAGIPWMPMTGNHDDPSWLNRYYDYATYGPGQTWFGGSYPENKLDCSYWFVTVGQREYMILSLGWAPNWDALEWAKGVVEAHPEKNVIINAHALINKDGELLQPGVKYNISSDHPGFPDGIDVWNTFREYKNVVLAMCGHVGCPDIISSVNTNSWGTDITTLLIDNQNDGASNSKGMIAVLTFRADSNAVELNWYSTKLDAMYGPENRYAIDVPHVTGGTTEAENITDAFSVWYEGCVRWADGTHAPDSQLKYSDFIPVGEFDRLELTLCARSGYTAPGGFAFYTDASPNSFLSHGAAARTGNGAAADGTVTRSVAVPEGARYIRVTYWADSSRYASVPFRCVGYKTVPDCVHEYRESVTDPTCTAPGCTTYTCSLCGYSYTENDLPATGHSFGPWLTVTEASCDAGGEEYRVCSTCGARETEAVSALGHSMISVLVPPTCTQPGYGELTCERCGYTEPQTAMTDITDRFHWYSHMATQATTGKQVSDGNWMASDYVDISAWTVLELVTANTASANTVFGLAFYDGDRNYISGIRHTDGSGVYGTLIHTVDVPENAVYLRTTWYSPTHPQYQDSFGEFYCLARDEMYLEPLGHRYENGICTGCGREEPDCLPGDVNGDGTVDTTDAYLIVLYYNERQELSDAQLAAADVTGDGTVDTTDAYYIVLYYNERIPSFPSEQ